MQVRLEGAHPNYLPWLLLPTVRLDGLVDPKTRVLANVATAVSVHSMCEGSVGDEFEGALALRALSAMRTVPPRFVIGYFSQGHAMAALAKCALPSTCKRTTNCIT